MANLTSIHSQLSQLIRASNNQKNPQIDAKLVEAKIALSSANLLAPSPASFQIAGPSAQPTLSNVQLARSILELGALYSIRTQDVKGFERYMSQLGVFYRDWRSLLPPSDSHAPLLALSLLDLLAQNRLGEFHTELESLGALFAEGGQGGLEKLERDPYIGYPIKLERSLMEGSYSKVWVARSHVPLPEFRIFVDQLVGTIRSEIASCGERAYVSLPFSDARTLLFFEKDGELMEFAAQRGWQIDPTTKTIRFPGAAAEEDANKTELPKEKVIESTLQYAKELEQIV